MAISNSKQQQQTVRAVSFLQLIAGVIYALFTGWLILIAWLGCVWWQKGYLSALTHIAGWVNTEKVEWQLLLHSETQSLQRGFQYMQNDMWMTTNKWITDINHDNQQAEIALTHETIVTQNKNNVTMQHTLNQITVFLRELYRLIGLVTQLVWMKLMTWLLAFPLFMLMAVVGLADGLMLRAVRKASLGRESAYLFHTMLALLPKLLTMSVCLFIVLPVIATPQYALWSVATLTGIWIALMTSQFKKYI
ncbi:MAG: DUF4400 domain-containing protein [Gammaproteobacteria bacterium]